MKTYEKVVKPLIKLNQYNMIIFSIRTNKTTVLGQQGTIERESDPIYEISKDDSQMVLRLTIKELEELKNILGSFTVKDNLSYCGSGTIQAGESIC